MSKIIDIAEAVGLVTDGMTVMVGGFMGCGTPHRLVSALVEAGVKDLTLISNDASFSDDGVGKLVENSCLRRLIASHIGLNPNVATLIKSGQIQVDLVPQGTLAERIRAGGAGLGGVLTPTGLDTPVSEGKQVVVVAGKRYLLEEPLRADVALINGHKVDSFGNTWYRGTTRNFNAVMAMAASMVVVEADIIVGQGEIPPEDIVTPGILVQHIVKGDVL